MFKTFLLNGFFIFVLGGVSFAADNATIENDHGKEKPKNGFALENRFNESLKPFSLRSNYQFRGDKVIDNSTPHNNYISLNTSISYQKGQSSYTIPYKKKVVLNRFTFNPNESFRNYSK